MTSVAQDIARNQFAALRRTHGMCTHPAYNSWRGMVNRCRNASHVAWPRYGGRGITVCGRWDRSFDAFWHDMGPSYAPGLTLDRRNVNGNYHKRNCRWLTPSEQGMNTRNTLRIKTPWGLLTVTEAASASGVNVCTLKSRIKVGCPYEKLFRQSTHKPRK